MGTILSAEAKAEWRQYWALPIMGCLGYCCSGLQTHAIGPFVIPLQQAFHWSRAQISIGLTICSLGMTLLVALMGMLIDRFGPRRVGLAGVLIMPAGIALLGTASGTTANWAMLWMVVAMGSLCVAGTTWTSAVASRFDAGRGMAIAITISGGSLSVVVLPPLATWLILHVGWRHAFFGLGAIMAAALFPLMFRFFHGAQDDRRRGRGEADAPVIDLPGVSVAEGLRMPAFYALMLAGGSFTFAIIGIVVNIVPMMVGFGATPMRAACIASTAGLFSIAGRLATGALLDRYPGHLVGACAYLIPLVACALLLTNGTSPACQFAAAAIIGMTMGAELDVVSYLSTRYFGMRNVATMLGAVMSATGLGLATGPLAANAIYDHFHGYAPFLVITIGLMLLSAAALLSLRRAPMFATGAV
jgi:MFS family permease